MEINDKYPEKVEQMLASIKLFCKKKLNREYYDLCDDLLYDILIEDWPYDIEEEESNLLCASIIYIVGSINFLFDDSFKPYISLEELSEYFSIDIISFKRTGDFIKEQLFIMYFDNLYSTSYILNRNPFHKYVYYNDVFTPLDEFPEDIIEKVKEKRKFGSEVYLENYKNNPRKVKIKIYMEKPFYLYQHFFNKNDLKATSIEEFISNLSKSLEEKMKPKNIKEILI